MSSSLISKAFNTKISDPLSKLLLIKMCDATYSENGYQGVCTTDKQTLIEFTSAKPERLENALKKLEKAGLVRTIYDESRSRDIYQISFVSGGSNEPCLQ